MPQKESPIVRYFLFDNHQKTEIDYEKSSSLEFKKLVCTICFYPLYRAYNAKEHEVIWHCGNEGCLIQQHFPLQKERESKVEKQSKGK